MKKNWELKQTETEENPSDYHHTKSTRPGLYVTGVSLRHPKRKHVSAPSQFEKVNLVSDFSSCFRVTIIRVTQPIAPDERTDFRIHKISHQDGHLSSETRRAYLFYWLSPAVCVFCGAIHSPKHTFKDRALQAGKSKLFFGPLRM